MQKNIKTNGGKMAEKANILVNPKNIRVSIKMNNKKSSNSLLKNIYNYKIIQLHFSYQSSY